MQVYTLDVVTIAVILAYVNTPTVMSTAVASSPLASPGAAHDSVHAERGLRSARLADDEQRSGVGPIPVILSMEDCASQVTKQLISTISSHSIGDGPKHQRGEKPVPHAVRSKSAMRPSLGVVSEMTTVQESIQPNQVPEVADSAGKLVLFAKSPHGIEMGKKGLRHLSNYWATRQRGVVGVLADLKLTKRKLNFYRIKALEDFIEDAFGVEKCDTELTKALVVIYGESHLSFLLTYNLLKKRNTDYALKLLAGVMTPWVNGGFTVEKVAGMLHHTKGIDFDQVAGMLRHTKGIDFKQVVQNLASSSTSASKAQYINLWTLKLYNGLCSHKRPELAIKEMFLK